MDGKRSSGEAAAGVAAPTVTFPQGVPRRIAVRNTLTVHNNV
ncbi:hypothetical protein Sros_6687 [Streptosporangium roseum DSM 43021]|uniref:Uncharacterized protein n=1 Tax=Streptosporangium roseum (strain ATCC 12428 / DSM 43021 / JCM 3005 / KCTC 9067 / NCIMB 10171 / NRRL 2505 / NI 9100) TaxID=479432 RepID=D2B3W1_STRRD|nr:hypothetical protein Sros_6687 [Streptosporangium roseum DSM 43021]